MRGRIADLSLSPFSHKQKLTLEIDDDFRRQYDELNGKDLEISLKPYKKKRSLDSNAYAWVLMGKLAAKTGIPVTMIYRSLIRDVGGNSETVCVKNQAVERLITAWGQNGIGWVADTMPSKIRGCTNVILYYGSSTYDTAQMSRLVDLIVSHCEEQGIDTMTPNEIANMMSRWRNAP